MSKRLVRLPRDGQPMLDIFSLGRAGPARSFTPQQIQQIARTIRRVPEVMVKVTGGGVKVGAVEAHLSYISRKGELEIEMDTGVRVSGRDEQKSQLADWHLDLSAGQYRGSRDGRSKPRKSKLVYNIVLSMPSGTAPEKVLAGARRFGQENFAFQHRYGMVLHTDRQHPHVHMVVKAEGEDGQRLHVDKAMLRNWRDDFARMMREQGVAANATPRVVRGRNRGKTRDARYRAQRHGTSTAARSTMTEIVKELYKTGTFKDPARPRLVETRRAVVKQWMTIADTLETQGETVLAGEVRYFAQNLPQMSTRKEQLARQFIEHQRAKRLEAASNIRQSLDRTR